MRNMKDFGNLIAAQRKQAGMTQENFAIKLGITPQAVSKWENGIGYPDITLFPAIASVLGISIETLFVEQTKTISQYPEFYEGLPFCFSQGLKACYSNKEVDHIDKKAAIAYFKDESTADLNSGIAVNKGKGEIRFMEHDENVILVTQDSPEALNVECEPFCSIDVSDSIQCDIEIAHADDGKPRLTAEGTKEFIASLRYRVENEKLTVNMQTSNGQNANNSKNKLSIFTNFDHGKYLKLSLNGSGVYTVRPNFDESILSINGSGTMKTAETQKLTARINGSGTISTEGATEETNLLINGSGDLYLNKAKNTKIQVNGSGDIRIRSVSGDLSGKINGSGDITASGEINDLRLDIRGSGNFGGNIIAENADIRSEGSAEIRINHIKGTSVEKISKNSRLIVGKRG